MMQPGLAPLGRTRFWHGWIVAAILGLALCAVGGPLTCGNCIARVWLAWLFWLSVHAGLLGLDDAAQFDRRRLGWATRRVLEAGRRHASLDALLIIPLLSGLEQLYTWARPEVVAADQLLQHKQPFLNVPFFVCRAAVYFGLWLLWAWLVRRAERQLRARPERIRRASAVLEWDRPVSVLPDYHIRIPSDW